MQKVSQEWKDAQRLIVVPPSQIEISVGVGDPDAQSKAVCSDNGHEEFSDVQVVTDASRKTPVKYATLEPGLWVLDGTYRLLKSEVAPAYYTITASVYPTGGGTITGAGRILEGTEITLTAVPEDGYSFIVWQENGETVSTDTKYTFTVEKNRNLTAVFEVNIIPEYTFTVNTTDISLSSLLKASKLTVAGQVINQAEVKITTQQTTAEIKFILTKTLSIARYMSVNGVYIGYVKQIGDSISTTIPVTDGMVISIEFTRE